MTRSYRLSASLCVVFLLASTLVPVLPVAGQESSKHPGIGALATSITQSLQNEYIRVDAAADGYFVIGTTGGDPSTALDDNKRLLYGFSPGGMGSAGTSFTSIRITDPATGTRADYRLQGCTVTETTAVVGLSLETAWTCGPVAVRQSLSLARGPGGTSDAVQIAYRVANTDVQDHSVAPRLMLDTMIGNNDGAPFVVPGTGKVTTEREYLDDTMPRYWQAFESASFSSAQLRGLGQLIGSGLVTPQRVVLAAWPSIVGTVYDYAVSSSRSITGDSAVAVYWQARHLLAGSSATFITTYGLSSGGGLNWLEGSRSIDGCNPRALLVTAWFANTSSSALSPGSVTVNLPTGLALADGESATQHTGIPAYGAASVSWRLHAARSVKGPLSYSVSSTFSGASYPVVSRTVDVASVCQEPIVDFLMDRDAYWFQNFSDDTGWEAWQAEMSSILQAYTPAGITFTLLRVVTLPFMYINFEENGYCYGMSATAMLYWLLPPMKPRDAPTYSLGFDEAKPEIVEYQYQQYLNRLLDLGQDVVGGGSNAAFSLIEANLRLLHIPALISMWGDGKGHAVVAYDIVSVGDTRRVQIYDSNYPGETREIVFDLANNTFSDSDYSYFDTIYLESPDPQADLAPEVITGLVRNAFNAILRSLGDDGLMLLQFHSPVTALATDSQGRRIGYLSDGSFVNEIAGAEMYMLGDEAFFYLPAGSRYTVVATGTTAATPGSSMGADVLVPVDQAHTRWLSYQDVPVTTGATVTLTVAETNTDVALRLSTGETRQPSADVAVDNTIRVFVPMAVRH